MTIKPTFEPVHIGSFTPRINRYEAKVGANGALYSSGSKSHVTIHRNGNIHKHGSFSDNPGRDSWSYQESWVSKDSLIGKIIDKGPHKNRK